MMAVPIRRLVALAGAAVVLALTAVPAASASLSSTRTEAAKADPVSLVGLGSDDPFREVLPWASELYGSSKSLTLTYDVVGGYEGRSDYLNGIGDFVVSGLPWTSSQLAQLPASDGGLISAPFMVSAVGLALAWGPTYELNRTCSQDETGCVATSKYEGTMDIPASTLTDLVWNSIKSKASNGTLTDQSILSATSSQIPQGADQAPPTISVAAADSVLPAPVSLLRSDPSETSYYLQEFAKAAAPAEFSQIPDFKGPVSEYLQGENASQYVVTYNGADAQVGFMTNEGGSVVADNPQGLIAALPPSALTGAAYFLPPKTTFTGTAPAYNPAWIGVQNASGQFVTPSPATIDAAVDAGGATPLYGLSNPVRGSTPAYPLTYVDDIYVPAHGLTADKTEAIATVMRYVATAGQDATEADNDGQLPPALVQQALAGANQVVASNCTASTEEVTVTSDLGRYAPTLVPMDGKSVAQRQAEIDAIGPMLHCMTIPASTATTTTVPATTTTVARTTTTTAVPQSIGSSSTAGNNTVPATTTPTTVARSVASKPTPTATTTTTVPSITGPISLLNLPMPIPSRAAVFEKLVGLVIGGVVFLFLWRARSAIMKLFGS